MRGTDIPLDYNPTIAVDVKRLTGLSDRYECIVWDFAGQEQFSLATATCDAFIAKTTR